MRGIWRVRICFAADVGVQRFYEVEVMAITKLFSLYKDSYVKQLPDEQGGGVTPMSDGRLAMTAKNEFLLKNVDGYSVRIKKRGTSFYHRCVCWFEDRGFPRIGTMRQTRQRASNEFATAVSNALFELGIEGHDEHHTVLMIRDHASKSLPLRSNLVRAVLDEVAELGYTRSPEIWEHDAPLYTKETFEPDLNPVEDVELPDYEQARGIPPLDEQEDLGAPPAYEAQSLPVNEAPPAYDDAVADQGNVRDPDDRV